MTSLFSYVHNVITDKIKMFKYQTHCQYQHSFRSHITRCVDDSLTLLCAVSDISGENWCHIGFDSKDKNVEIRHRGVTQVVDEMFHLCPAGWINIYFIWSETNKNFFVIDSSAGEFNSFSVNMISSHGFFLSYLAS